MPKQVQKKKHNKHTRRAAKRRERRLTMIAVCALIFLCAGSLVTMSMINARRADRNTGRWYVEGGDVQVLAPPGPGTLERRSSEGASTLPFLRPTAEATQAAPQATLVPEITLAPEATLAPQATFTPQATVAPTPTAEPLPFLVVPQGTLVPETTFAPQATLVPEATVAPTPTAEPLPFLVAPQATLVPQATAETRTTIKITAVGDCTLGGNVPSGGDARFDRYVQKYGYDYFLDNVRELFASDDLTIVNLEGPLTDSNDMRKNRPFNFRGAPEYVRILSGSSVEIANVANNHALDYGDSGFQETVRTLQGAGIGASGFGEEYYGEVNGVTVGSLGFTEWDDSEAQIVSAVRAAREKCDLLLVSVHWGLEGEHKPQKAQRALGRAIVDAGADLVIGNHSHVYGGVELYRGKYIIYSLGNFCFGGNRNPADKDCAIFQQTFVVEPDGTLSDGGINILPARISSSNGTNDFQPCLLSGEKGSALVRKIAKVSIVDQDSMVWTEDSYEVQNGIVALSR